MKETKTAEVQMTKKTYPKLRKLLGKKSTGY